ncbi:MAG: hypothetical protein EXS05_09870 [Planctomycetaceae bacterium]|nr:hypothetical protein [Planctomycetaceae bacterium]
MRRMRAFLAVLCAAFALFPFPVAAQTDVKRLIDDPFQANDTTAPSGVALANWQPETPPIGSDVNAVADASGASGGVVASPAMSNPGGAASAPGPWWVIAPYAWIPGMYGEITSFGHTNQVNIDTSDILSQLHNANGALQLHLESGVGNVGLILDTNIIRLSADKAVSGGSFDFNFQQTLVECLGMYRILEVPSDGMPQQAYSVDLLAGGRYYNFFNGITFTPFDPSLPTIPLGQSGTWVDLVIGARGRAPIVTGLDAFLRTDFGGFGMGTSSTLAWNLIAGIDWHATEHFSFLAGYRVLGINESQGTGGSQFAFHARMQGPFVALALRY